MGMTPLLMSLTYVSLNGNESVSDGVRKLLVVMGMSPLDDIHISLVWLL